MPETLRISTRFRLGLAAKGALLLAFALGFAALAIAVAGESGRSALLRVGVAGLFGFQAAFLGWASWLAFLDAALGAALRESGAEPLASRRSGRSMRLPGGRYLEYLLWNSWAPLESGCRYTVTYGRASGVLVARPEKT